jgi:hypothetical protein
VSPHERSARSEDHRRRAADPIKDRAEERTDELKAERFVVRHRTKMITLKETLVGEATARMIGRAPGMRAWR